MTDTAKPRTWYQAAKRLAAQLAEGCPPKVYKCPELITKHAEGYCERCWLLWAREGEEVER